MDNLKKLEELLLEEDGLLISLKLAKRFDEDIVEKIASVLKSLKEEWKGRDSIPKAAVDLFIDFYPAMEGISKLYPDEEAVIIMDIAYEIMDLIRDCIYDD